MFLVCAKLHLVCGVVLVLFNSKSDGQYYGGYGTNIGYQNYGPRTAAGYGYSPSYDQDYGFKSYRRSYNSVTLPDGRSQTEEIVSSSNGTPEGTNTYANTYGDNTLLSGPSYGTSRFTDPVNSPTGPEYIPSNRGLGNRNSDLLEQTCAVPISTEHMNIFYHRSGTYGEGLPTTQDSVASANDYITFNCDPGYTITPPVFRSICNLGYWFPTMPSCVEQCTQNSQCSQGKVCVNNQCIESQNAPCGRSCGHNAECKMLNGQYTCGCVYGFLYSEEGCQPSSSFGCVEDNECSQGKICFNNRCKDPCQVPCDRNSECKKVNRGYKCVCKNGFVDDQKSGCQPISKPECQSNTDCDDNYVCRKEKCVDPCGSLCGENATCTVKDHQPKCACKPGFIRNKRNPTLGCQLEELCPPLNSRNMNMICKLKNQEVPCSSSIKPDTIVIPTCHQYFKPDKEPEHSQLTCLPDGKWNHQLYNCVQDEELCPPLKSRNMHVKCKYQEEEVSCEGTMKPGTIATAECNQYYKPIQNQGHSQSTCLPTGHWDYPLFNCTPVCGKSTEIVITTSDVIAPRIIDGKEAYVGMFPWHAGVYFRQGDNWVQRCGGSLISDQFVLTAAHCVHKETEEDIRIALGKYYRSWDRIEDSQQTRDVSKIIYPSDFHKPTLYFDVALLRLDKKIEVGKLVMPVCSRLLDGSMDLLNKKLFLAGWGQTRAVQTGSESETLQYNDVMLITRNNCQKLIPGVISLFDKFCAIKNNNSAVSVAQPGDSGGGLTVVFDERHYIFGVVSGKIEQVTMFTNVTWVTHLMWIENEVRQYDRDFRWSES